MAEAALAPESTRQRVLRERAAGRTQVEIAAALGISRQAVHHHLKAAGLTLSWAHEDVEARRAALVEDVRTALRSGGPAQVVARLGYPSAKALARALRRAGDYELARRVERVR